MPNSYFSQPAIFLIEVLFGLYITIVALRIIMQWAQWEYHHPLVQIIIKATQVPVKFLRQYIPAIGKWDSATFVLLLVLTALKLSLLLLLQQLPIGLSLIQLVLADIFSLFITLFSAAIIIQVILSWVQPHTQNAISPLISRMTNPLLRPIRRLLPPMSGLDLSPLIALIGLQVLSMLILPILTMAI